MATIQTRGPLLSSVSELAIFPQLTRRTGRSVAAVPSCPVIRAYETRARESYCLTLLFPFQCEGVDIVGSYVANQHWRVCRIKTHPTGECPCVTESLQIDNALRIATRYADSKHARIIQSLQEVDELAIRRPRWPTRPARSLHYRPSLRLQVEDFHASCAGVQPDYEAAVG